MKYTASIVAAPFAAALLAQGAHAEMNMEMPVPPEGSAKVVATDAAVRDVRKVFSATQVELYGGGGTDLDVGLRAFIERTHDPIDLLVIVSDCHTTWSNDVPPFPVITIRVGDGTPPPWGNRGANRVISIENEGG